MVFNFGMILDAILEVLSSFHAYDILVNNAGIRNEENLDLTFDINLVSITNGIKNVYGKSYIQRW